MSVRDVLRENTESIINHLAASDIKSVGDGLYEKGLIERNTYEDQVVNSTRGSASVARPIVMELVKKVDVEESNFDRFIQELKNKGLTGLVDLLEKSLEGE